MFDAQAATGRVRAPVQVLRIDPLTTASCFSGPVANRARIPASALSACSVVALLFGAAVMLPKVSTMVGKAMAKEPLVRRPPTLAKAVMLSVRSCSKRSMP